MKKNDNRSIKVSFILPVYNMEAFLAEALDSLCGQTLQEIEIICVDDGSTDQSLAILEKYKKKDPRISVFRNKAESFGAAIPRNLGLSKAVGTYLLVVDPDDKFHPQLAEKTYRKAVETDGDIVLFDAEKFHSDTGEIIPTNQFLNPDLLPSKEVFAPDELADRLFLLGDGVAWNKLIRRQLIAQHGLEFYPVAVVDDMNFTFSALVLAKRIGILPEKLLYYRVGNGESQMANLHRDPLTPVKVLARLKAFLEEKHLFDRYQQSYRERGLGLCMFYFDGLKSKEDFCLLYHCLQGKQGQGYPSGCSLADLGLVTEGLENPAKKDWLEQVGHQTADEFLQAREIAASTLVQAGKPYGIYGFGVRANLIYEKIHEFGGQSVAISDSSPEKWGQYFQGMTVLSPEIFQKIEMEKVFISSPNYYEEIKKSLISLGFSENKIAFI